jgi:hypothetical protein
MFSTTDRARITLRKLVDELEYSSQSATVEKQVYEAAYNQVKLDADELMEEQEERFREKMVRNCELNLTQEHQIALEGSERKIEKMVCNCISFSNIRNLRLQLKRAWIKRKWNTIGNFL